MVVPSAGCDPRLAEVVVCATTSIDSPPPRLVPPLTQPRQQPLAVLAAARLDGQLDAGLADAEVDAFAHVLDVQQVARPPPRPPRAGRPARRAGRSRACRGAAAGRRASRAGWRPRRAAPRRRSRPRGSRPSSRRRPRPPSRPAAPRAMTAPAPSTTSFERSTSSTIVSAMSSSATVTSSSSSASSSGPVSSPGCLIAMPSAIVAPAPRPRRRPPTPRAALLDRRRDTRRQATAADRHDDAREVRHVVEQLEPHPRLAGDHVEVVERVHERPGPPTPPRRAPARRTRAPPPLLAHLRAERAHRLDLRHGGVDRHEHAAGSPLARAAYASACAWLPALPATTPRGVAGGAHLVERARAA